MNNINVDHEDLRDFSTTLEQYASEFDGIREKINGTLNSITENEWGDNKFEQFRQKYIGKSEKDMLNVIKLMQDYAGYLKQKAEIVERYQNNPI